ncbi:MAG: NAD-glutamate dehydrogenase, partial [Gammaproteobacteria bacterium]|nr:NAD-glutamate dehydrogenase [Gammaproteobacteria bacterium]
ICFQIEKQLAPDVLQSIEQMIRAVMLDISLANRDWQAMKQRVRVIADGMDPEVLPVDSEALKEERAFLEWTLDDQFTYLAYCEFDLRSEAGEQQLVIDCDSRLGLFRDTGSASHDPKSVVPALCGQYTGFPGHLVVTKANVKSTVHRPAYMDYIGVKRLDQEGRVTGLFCIIGLFTIAAYSSPPRDIPLLRTKVAEVTGLSRLVPASFSGKVLQMILVTFPRDDLFQIPVRQLAEISFGILGLQERHQTRLFMFQDAFDRFFSILIYLPREQYNRELRLRVQKLLVSELKSTEVEFTTFFSESMLARLHFVIRSSPETPRSLDQEQLQRKVIEACKSWQDGLREELLEKYGEAETARYSKQYLSAFPGGYREDFFPRTAAVDIARIEVARSTNTLGMHFYRPIIESSDRAHFRLYSLDQPVPLSRAIPILEHMGLSVFGEQPYHIRDTVGDVWIHDFSMRYARHSDDFSDQTSARFQECFQKVWEGLADNDGFNQLVLAAGLSWRQVFIIRAYSQYLQQIKSPYSRTYVIKSLTRHPVMVRTLIELFAFRFDPRVKRSEAQLSKHLSRIESLLESVSSLDEDRILRSFVNLVMSTLRTNYYQTSADGSTKSYLAFKIDPSQVSNMPLPRPMYEIFVFSVQMEGVHLRGGRVARGGLRWSDRMEDFRTEVLGLMKAQMVKNTVIVPVGSKGGFVVKRLPVNGSQEQTMELVVECYKTFLRGMLDLTDNLVDGKPQPPGKLVRYDSDDTYLVIAADKGTATFSDIANGVAAEYRFWLGDAFASGGSQGYDHKRMGITAKGAWESVKRNFRELGIDIQHQDFRVIGIGDMSGDVFGNGLLLSPHIKLVGAFNHMHIFLDPNPDPECSFKERARLFALPRSGWSDYDRQLISPGGGVYARTLKSVPLSDEVKSLLGVKVDRLPPNELINQLLKAPVDLLWNGGIGTYVKAETETHENVGDKANESLRVNGNELRCKVVGEGGNLGFTQLGRVEFASKGGLIYTDAIDNSAGVDCSDHEVNIKILLGQIVANGEMTGKQRNRLLTEMTDEIARLVLAHNYSQTQAISLVAWKAQEKLYEHARFIDSLEQRGRLNRNLEFLPNAKAIAERQAKGLGLTKPEIAVLHAYSKMNYYNALVESDIPDDPYLQSDLTRYFPRVLAERFPAEMHVHRLRREITATHLTNRIVDHVGPGFAFRVREEVGADIAGLTRAYVAVSEIFGIDALWGEIEALDNRVPAATQMELMLLVTDLLRRAVIWLLRHQQQDNGIQAQVDYYQGGVQQLAARMPKPLTSTDRLALNRRVKMMTNAGVPRELAQRVGILSPLASALDIVKVAKQSETDILLVASLYFALGKELQFHWLREQIGSLRIQTHWHDLARTRLGDMLNTHQREITAHILTCTAPSKNARRMLEEWKQSKRYAVERHAEVVSEFRARSSLDFALLSMVVAGAESLH